MAFIKIANLDELPASGVLARPTRFGRIAVARGAGDELFAFQDLCTHDDGPLAGGRFDPAEACIECPRHGARFNVRTGAVLCMPATEPIEVYPVRVRDGAIEVDLE